MWYAPFCSLKSISFERKKFLKQSVTCGEPMESIYYHGVKPPLSFPVVCVYCGSSEDITTTNTILKDGRKTRPQCESCCADVKKKRVGYGKKNMMAVSTDTYNITILRKSVADTWPTRKCKNVDGGSVCGRDTNHLCTMKLPETGMYSFNGERICGMPFCAICCASWGCEHERNRCKNHMS